MQTTRGDRKYCASLSSVHVLFLQRTCCAKFTIGIDYRDAKVQLGKNVDVKQENYIQYV